MPRKAEPNPTVFIVDDDDALRGALCGLLTAVGLHAEAYPTAEAFLEALDPERPGCVVLDIKMPGMGGLALQEHLGQSGCPLPVIILTGHADVPVAVRCVRAGAVGFLEKPVTRDTLVAAIDEALKVNQMTLADHRQRRRVVERIASLTEREGQVMRLLVRGMANKMIADHLGISARTVEVHRARVMEKTGAGSVAELVEMVLRSRPDAADLRA